MVGRIGNAGFRISMLFGAKESGEIELITLVFSLLASSTLKILT